MFPRNVLLEPFIPPERPDTRALGFRDQTYRAQVRSYAVGPGVMEAHDEEVEVRLTAESQRRTAELADWWRECEYAGILGVELPPPPPWHKPFRRVTRIMYG